MIGLTDTQLKDRHEARLVPVEKCDVLLQRIGAMLVLRSRRFLTKKIRHGSAVPEMFTRIIGA